MSTSLLVRSIFIGCIGLGCIAGESVEQGEATEALVSGFVKTRVVGGLVGASAMALAPDGRIFVVERGTNNAGGTATGKVRIIKNGVLLPTPFATVTVDNTKFACCNERGLNGIALDPAFAQNGFVYVFYTVPSSQPYNRVSRFKAAGDVAQAGSETLVLALDSVTAQNHYGGALHFGGDGKLYVSVGDAAVRTNAQSLSNRHGKILRLNADGTIPTDNPTSFAGVTGAPSGANRAIWAVGLRNPFTFAVHPTTGRIFVNDVGEGQREEINELGKGRNYGWPSQEGFLGADHPNFTRPLIDYGHADGSCAITGGAFYHPLTNTFGGSYLDRYFFADFCGGWIRLLDPASRSISTIDSGFSFPVDLDVGSDGALYVLATGSGEIWRIQRSGTQPPPPPPPPPSGTIRVNFQLGSAPVPSGYLPDSGLVYAARNGRTYGWNVDHSDVTRDRNLNPDQRLDTLSHFHRGGVWEIAVPNGSYRVTVSIGDPQYPSAHTLNVEGTNYWNGLSLGVNAFANATKTVQVGDGKLTLDQGTAIEKATRINYIEIAPASP